MKTMTKNDLWSVLQQASLVQGTTLPQTEKHSPWFVRAMLGIAGWLGAMFLVGFVAVSTAFQFEESSSYTVMGALAVASATMLFRAKQGGDFISQFGLAVAIAGEILMAVGLSGWVERSFTTAAFLLALQQAVLFLLMPNFVHRVWAAGTAALAFCFGLGGLDLHALILPLITAALALVWLREFHRQPWGEQARASGYGLAFTAIFFSYIVVGDWLDWRDHRRPPMAATILQGLAYAGSALMVVVMIGSAITLLRREHVTLSSGMGKAALALALILALASVKAPGLAPASLILLLGFANGNRVLTGIGVVALLAYLSHYYYALHATLLEKSVMMMNTGVALLGLRLASSRWWPVLNKE